MVNSGQLKKEAKNQTSQFPIPLTLVRIRKEIVVKKKPQFGGLYKELRIRRA